MTSGSFERYGLTSNPFRDLASENLADVEIYHVNLQIDRALSNIREEVYERENRAFVALVGPLGAGKTERLLLTLSEAHDRKAFAVYFDITAKTTWVLKGLAAAFLKASTLSGLSKTFSQPGWYREVSALQGLKDQKYDASAAGKAIARALNENAPSVLLLNDLHNLTQSAEVDQFVKTLQEVADGIKAGVLVMIGSYPNYLSAVARAHPAFASRINRTFSLPALNDEEASLLLAKKLLAKRLVEDLEPLYPFEREAVSALNQAIGGNPRRLLELSDHVIEHAAEHRAYRIDADLVRAVLASRQAAEAIAAVRSPSAPPSVRTSVPAPRAPSSGVNETASRVS